MSGIVNSAGSRSGVIGTTELDYEEGTFTASLSAATPPSSVPTAPAHYRLIGGICHFNIRRWSNVSTSGASGQWKITGMPFSPVISCIVGGSLMMYNWDYDPAHVQCFEMDANNNVLFAWVSRDSAQWVQWSIAAGTSRYVSLSGSYIIN